MQRTRRKTLALLFALILGLGGHVPEGTAQAQVSNPPPPALTGRALVNALRAGGYIIYFRHTSTDFGQNDERMTGYEDCASQRNLTDQGRDEARAVGASLRELGIPVGDVLASPFCRTMETAQLMFGRAAATPSVRGGPAQPDSADRYTDLRKLLGMPVARGANLVIVSHGNPFRAVVGGAYLAEGEAAIIKAEASGTFSVVAHVRKDEWKSLAVT